MSISKYIDHTLLKPIASKKDIETLCNEAIKHQFYSVCVNSYYVPLANQFLNKSSVTEEKVVLIEENNKGLFKS